MDRYIAGSNDTLLIKRIEYDPSGPGYNALSFPHGSLLIQTATTSAGCVTTCMTKVWIVDCPVGCTTPTFKQLALSAP